MSRPVVTSLSAGSSGGAYVPPKYSAAPVMAAGAADVTRSPRRRNVSLELEDQLDLSLMRRGASKYASLDAPSP